jgi:Domain of unknown function (DUF6969)
MRTAHSIAVRPRPRGTPAADAQRLGAAALMDCYRELSGTGAHLLDPVLQGSAPTQWEHYPPDDAISRDSRYQWFYHSHSAADRPGSAEHGHFHLFARMESCTDTIAAGAEQGFRRTIGATDSERPTGHLICIGMSPVGVPINLFTVNRWVTGDMLLSMSNTLLLLDSMRLDTGYSMIDSVLMGLLQMYRPEIRALMRKRDATLQGRAGAGPGTLDDVRVEVLSEVALDIDRRIGQVLQNQARRWTKRS